MASKPLRRIPLTELNPHLICVLCKGYYIEATTIIECLHSFCKSCIVRYFHSSVFCPICDVQVHKTRPLLSLREDRTLQDVVYKLVPGLFEAEMDRRASFYANNPQAVGDKTEQSLREKRHFFHVDDQISLSLEYLPPAHAHAHVLGLRPIRAHYATRDTSCFKLTVPATLSKPPLSSVTNGKEETKGKAGILSDDPTDTDEQTDSDRAENVAQNLEMEIERQRHEEEAKASHRRYLKCPAASTIRLLAKFIRLKYNLSIHHQVDIMHAGDCLSSDLTLLDVVYMYKWNEDAPLKFLYTVLAPPSVPTRKRIKPCISYKPKIELPLQLEPKNRTSPLKPSRVSPHKDGQKHQSPKTDERHEKSPVKTAEEKGDKTPRKEGEITDNAKRKDMDEKMQVNGNGDLRPKKKIRLENSSVITKEINEELSTPNESSTRAPSSPAKAPDANNTSDKDLDSSTERQEKCDTESKVGTESSNISTVRDDVDEPMDCDSVNNQTIDSLDSSRDDGEGRMVIDESAQSPSDEDSTPPVQSPRPEPTKTTSPTTAVSESSPRKDSESSPIQLKKEQPEVKESKSNEKNKPSEVSESEPSTKRLEATKMNGTLVAAPGIPMVSIPRPLLSLPPYTSSLNNNDVPKSSPKKELEINRSEYTINGSPTAAAQVQVTTVSNQESVSSLTQSPATDRKVPVSSSLTFSSHLENQTNRLQNKVPKLILHKNVNLKDKMSISKSESILNKTITKLSLAAARSSINMSEANTHTNSPVRPHVAGTSHTNALKSLTVAPTKVSAASHAKVPSSSAVVQQNPHVATTASSSLSATTSTAAVTTKPAESGAALAAAFVNARQQQLAELQQQKFLQQLQQQQKNQEKQGHLQLIQQQKKILQQRQLQQLQQLQQASQNKVKFENLNQVTHPSLPSADRRSTTSDACSASTLSRSPFPTGFPYSQRPPFIAPTKPRLGRPPNPNKVASSARGSRGGKGSRGGRGRRGGLLPNTPRPSIPSQVAALQAIQNAQATSQLQQTVTQAFPLQSVNPALSKDSSSPPMDLSPTPKVTMPNLNSMRLIPPSPNPYSSLSNQQYPGMQTPNPYASASSSILTSSSPIAAAVSSPKTTPHIIRSSAGSPAEAGSVSPAATPRTAAPTPQTVPSPRPARSPAPASPSAPNLCSPTPEVTITKLSPASTSTTTTKSTTTNTISITKRSGISITASSTSDIRSASKSIPGKPSPSPAITKTKSNTVSINPKSPKSISNSSVTSPKHLNGKFNNNTTPSKKLLSNGLLGTSLNNLKLPSSVGSETKVETSRSGYSAISEHSSHATTSSILKIESLTRSLPPVSTSTTPLPLTVNGNQ
ncbi:RAWUL domain [Trinorchestia longiramus]|nr:RAWUL domain [Trinorchestia longiramus]